MKLKRNILTRGLPKTGQQTEFRTGDDKFYEAGWWIGTVILTSRTRYYTKIIDGDKITVDLATGLMWARDGNAAGCNNGAALTWEAAIDYAEALTFAGYSDWRVPNVNELCSVVIHSSVYYDLGWALIRDPQFQNTFPGRYWSSTTAPNDTTRAGKFNFEVGNYTFDPKTVTTHYLRCVRGGV